jgi:hypothetical protein
MVAMKGDNKKICLCFERISILPVANDIMAEMSNKKKQGTAGKIT